MTATSVRQPFRRRLLVSTLATGVGNLWAIVVGLALLPVLVRGLGVAGLGWWALLQTMSATGGWLSLADLGLRVSTVRAVAERAGAGDTAGARRIVSTSLAIYASAAAAGAGVLALLGPGLLAAVFDVPDTWRSRWSAAVLALALQVFAELLAVGAQAALEGWQRVDLARGLDALRRTLVALAAGSVALSSGRLDHTALAAALASCAAAALSLAVVARVNRGFGRIETTAVRSLVGYGSTVAVLNATGVLHRTMDRIVVGIALGPRAVAVVEIVTQLQNGAMAVMTSAAYVASSAAPWVEQRDRARVRELLVSGTRWCTLASVPAVVGLAALGPAFIEIWTGHRPPDVALLCALGALYIALSAPLQVASLMLQGLGRAAVVLRAAVLAVAVNLGLSVLLVGPLGIAGVFWGTVAGAVVLVLPLTRAACALVEEPAAQLLRQAALPALGPLAASIALVIPAVALPSTPVVTVVAGTAMVAVATLGTVLGTAASRAEVRQFVGIITGR